MTEQAGLVERDVADAELTEAAFMIALEEAAPQAVADELGIVTARAGGGVVLSMRNDPTGGYWNKALGFGIAAPVTNGLVEEVLGVYRENGSTVAVLQFAPAVLPPDWNDIASSHGLTASSVWVGQAAARDGGSEAGRDEPDDRARRRR